MSREAKIMLGIGLGFAAIIAVVAIGIKSQLAPQQVDVSKLIRAQSEHTGNSSAKVTLVEFGDYQCPACKAAYPAVKRITDSYTPNPDFNFVFRNFPLPQHQNAQISAEAAEAAGAQGKFWEMHDALYENQAQWSDSTKPLDLFLGYAQKIGLDINKFKQEVESNKYADLISGDLQDGQDLGINSTPTFYLNGQQLTGLSSFEDIKTRVQSEFTK